MKPTSIITMAAINATGVAAKTQLSGESELGISSFSASCIPHSVLCSYRFNVITSPDGPTASCNAFPPGPDNLPAVPLISWNNTDSVSWSFAVDDGYTLTVTTDSGPDHNSTGTYVIPDEQVIVENNGAVSDQRYVGPLNFRICDVKSVPT